MRPAILILCLALLGAGCSSSGSKTSSKEEAEKTSISEENLSHVHLDVKGMTCEGCENAIKASINKLDGIKEATASHTNEEVIIVFDSTQTDVHAISQAIENAGYSVAGNAAHPQH